MNDLISRSELLKVIPSEEIIARMAIMNAPTVEQPTDEWCTDCKEYDHEKNCCPRFNRVIRETLKDAQPTGEWIHYLGCGIGNAICSNCGQLGETKKYCGNCGARMRGGYS